MITKAAYELKNQALYPRFKDPEIEREYIYEFNREALKSGRIGHLIILFVWVGFTWFDWHLNDQVRSSALIFRLLVITPLLCISLASLYSKYAVRIYQMVVSFTLFTIESSIYHVVKFYNFEEITNTLGFELTLKKEDGSCLFIFTWLLVIFMSSIIARLNILQSIINGLFILLLCILSVLYYHPSTIVVIIAAPFLATTFFVVWFGSIHIQQYARNNFRATKLLAHSMKESESLLLNILPVQIAERLKKSPGTIANAFNNVSVLFADIVGFTVLSSRYKPETIVEMLNQIFTVFDQISKKYGAEKIKTIGDAYMLAAGIPRIDPKDSYVVANCALDMMKAAENFKDPDGNPIYIRIGIHTGPAIAGVIGTHKFAYDLWGDTVNMASRMESHGDAGKIQVTKEIFNKLKNDFIFERRNEIEIKGKGRMETFWLKGCVSSG